MLGTTRTTMPMFDAALARLLEEDRKLRRQERRATERIPLTRPVVIRPARADGVTHEAFAKNLSPHGLGLIHRERLEPRLIAGLEIHSLSGEPVNVRSEARWISDFGDGWYHSGWEFLAMSRT